MSANDKQLTAKYHEKVKNTLLERFLGRLFSSIFLMYRFDLRPQAVVSWAC